LRFRVRGGTAWHEGRLENFSHTGILFQADGLLAVHTPVEMQFGMPVQIGGKLGAEVICQGEIARTVPPASRDDPPRLAARIHKYRFVRRRARPRQHAQANPPRNGSSPELGRAPDAPCSSAKRF
jgi:hypothetical protein